jgi:plastocyanin
MSVQATLRSHLVLAAGALVVAVGLGGCGTDSKSLPVVHVGIVANPVGVPDSLYKPETVTVRVGQTVSWLDQDDMEHTVTPDQNYAGWNGGSSIMRHGQTYTATFTRPGVYNYHCMVHPGMFGTVIVIGCHATDCK